MMLQRFKGVAAVGERCTCALRRHIPPGQFGRYLLVGIFNTLFAYASFAALTAVLNPIVPHSYLLGSLVSSVLNITMAYLGYKWFVFKTKGKYFQEWLRCLAIYSGAILINLMCLPVLVLAIRRTTRFQSAAPYIAGAVLLGFTVIYSFLGHKKFSFRSPTAPEIGAEIKTS